MPESVYKVVFNNPDTSKLAKNDIDLAVYTEHSVDLIGKCTFFMLRKDTKQPVEVDFYVANDDSNVLLSCETMFQLHLLHVKPRLEYLPSRATLISSAEDYLEKEVHAQSGSIKQQHGIEAVHSGSILANYGPINCKKWTHNATRRHSKENQDCQNQGANQRTVSRTLWRNRQISRWTTPHPYRSIFYHQSKHPTDPSQYILKKPSSKRLTRCSKLVWSNLFMKKLHGSIALCWWKQRTKVLRKPNCISV